MDGSSHEVTVEVVPPERDSELAALGRMASCLPENRRRPHQEDQPASLIPPHLSGPHMMDWGTRALESTHND